MAREDREDSLSGFEDALDEMTPVMTSTLTKVMEEKKEEEETRDLMTRVRSASELKELKEEFDKEDAEHKGEISGESVGKMLRKSKSRIVKRVLSGGKFGVSELETLAKIRDSDNSHTSSFKELVEVLHAADTITEEESKSDEKLVENNKKIDSGGVDADDNDEWEKAEKRYTETTIERHHRRSSACRSVKIVEQKKELMNNKVTDESQEVQEEVTEVTLKEDEKESVDRIIRGVPHPKQNQAENCACACVLM